MFSRTAQTVRLYLYHNRYVLSFLSFGPSSGRGEIPVTAVPGCPNTGGSTQRAGASRRVGGDVAGGMGQHRSDAHEAGFIFPAGIAWLSWLFYPCPGRGFQLPLAVRQPLQVYPGGSLALAWSADLSARATTVGAFLQVSRHGLRPGLFPHVMSLCTVRCPDPAISVFCSTIEGIGSEMRCNPAGCRTPRVRCGPADTDHIIPAIR